MGESQIEGKPLILIPIDLAGILKLSTSRELMFDTEIRKILLKRRGYSGFRLYTKSIDDVQEIHDFLSKEDILTTTQFQRIAEVKSLEKHLGKIFFVISSVSISGGIAVLLSCLYGSTERKRKDLAVLKLLGLSSLQLAVFPALQSFIFVSVSFWLSYATFKFSSDFIDSIFRGNLEIGESFCALPLRMCVSAYAISCLVGILTSLFSAVQVMRVPTSEAMKD